VSHSKLFIVESFKANKLRLSNNDHIKYFSKESTI